MERVISCPVCFDNDNCFEDVQENYNSYLCFHCGFMSDSRYEVSSLQLVENLKKSPKLVQDLQYEDKNRNIVWFPSVINMGEKGIIYPEGTISNWHWYYANVVEIPEEEREQYEGHERRLDVDNAEKFGQFEFTGACMAMGIIKDYG